MKSTKILFGLGAMAMSLASCSKEAEYTPAEAVNTPPVYFSYSDESTIDLEETDTYFTVKVYRQDTSSAGDYNLSATLKTENGTAVPTDLFRISNLVTDADGNQSYQDYDNSTPFNGGTVPVHFNAGEGTANVVFSFGGKNNLTEMLSYIFDFTADGEASPYYITSISYDVSYTPWVDLQDNTIVDNTLYTAFGGRTFQFSVDVQEHPIKSGFFRIHAPYKSCSELSGYYQYDEETEGKDFLYINATVANEAYMSDSKGNPQNLYNTHIQYIKDQGFDVTYGHGVLGCPYSFYLNQEDFENYGGLYVESYGDFAGTAGSLVTQDKGDGRNPRKIRFNNGKMYGILSDVPGYGMVGMAGTQWELWVDGADESDEWRSLGEVEYTEAYIGVYYAAAGYSVTTYPVQADVSIAEPGVYRLHAPYGQDVWDWGTEENDNYVFIVDASNPECVKIENQTEYTDEDGDIQMCNFGGLYSSGVLADNDGNAVVYSDDEIIAAKMNDVLENGVITLNHPILITPDYRIIYLEELENFVPGKIVLPTASAGSSAKKTFKARKANFTFPRHFKNPNAKLGPVKNIRK